MIILHRCIMQVAMDSHLQHKAWKDKTRETGWGVEHDKDAVNAWGDSLATRDPRDASSSLKLEQRSERSTLMVS